MDRRRFLATAAVFGTTGVLKSYGQLPLVAQVPLSEVITAYKPQECPAWCWAASISMIFRFYGHPTDQRRIACALFGNPPKCSTAKPSQILALLNRTWTDDHGNRFRCETSAMYDHYAGVADLSVQDIIDSLNGGDPLLLCTTHHAMVLTEVHYRQSIGGPILLEMGVADPMPKVGLRSLDNFHNEGLMIERGGQLSLLATVKLTRVNGASGENSNQKSPTHFCSFGPLAKQNPNCKLGDQ